MKVVGYLLAGGFLLILNEFSPAFASGTMGLIMLGVLLQNPNSLTTLSNAFKGVTKNATSN